MGRDTNTWRMEMKSRMLGMIAAAVVMALAVPARAHLIQVFVEPDPVQDDWMLPENVHELGIGFPPEQSIMSIEVPWGGHIPCPSDYEQGISFQVQIQNMTGKDWPEVYYVGDPETLLTNWDERVGQMGFQQLGLAFKIDNVGANTPLVFESMTPDNIFEAGETWEFVIQDYLHPAGLPPGLFDSLGVAGASGGGPPSSGSIIAIPEPSTLILVSIMSAIGIFAYRRRLPLRE